MQPENTSIHTASVAVQVLDLIRVLRLAYSPVMIGAEAAARVHHALDVIGGEVARMSDEQGRVVAPHRLALVPSDELFAAPPAAPALPTPTADAPSPTAAEEATRHRADDHVSAPPIAQAIEAARCTAEPERESAAQSLASHDVPPELDACAVDTGSPKAAAAPPALGNEPREDVGRAFRSALLADLTRRSTRPASTPPALRTGPDETAQCPAHDASESTTPVRTAMPTS